MTRKAALVTGASRNIGRAIVMKLAQDGYEVGVHYRRHAGAAEEIRDAIEAAGGRAVCIQGDLTSLDDIQRIFDTFLEAFGRIDVLVNNAGITRSRPFLEVTLDQWQEVVNTDWRACFFCTQRAARAMIDARTGGAVVNISSNHQDGCWPTANVYGPTKAALNKFTRHAAMELARDGIRVNAVAPGYTLPDGAETGKKKVMPEVEGRIPLQRCARASEIADAVAFLVSGKAAYITGACLTVDGGALLPVVPENHFP